MELKKVLTIVKITAQKNRFLTIKNEKRKRKDNSNYTISNMEFKDELGNNLVLRVFDIEDIKINNIDFVTFQITSKTEKTQIKGADGNIYEVNLLELKKTLETTI